MVEISSKFDGEVSGGQKSAAEASHRSQTQSQKSKQSKGSRLDNPESDNDRSVEQPRVV